MRCVFQITSIVLNKVKDGYLLFLSPVIEKFWVSKLSFDECHLSKSSSVVLFSAESDSIAAAISFLGPDVLCFCLSF